MSKRKRNQNIEKKIKEGYGSGSGIEYKPWILIQDVPSIGRSSRIKGIKTERQYDFLSDLEKNYFYLLEYSDNIIDIREQYPLLPLEKTLLIADELGIKHPRNPETGEYIVMTTDFLITLNDGTEIARTVKSKDELLNKRVLEKFEIERRFWDMRDIDWGIVTENEINKTIAKNIEDIHSYKNISDIDSLKDIEISELKDLIYELSRRLIDSDMSLRYICTQFDSDMILEGGSALSIFRYLIINKLLKIDICQKIDVNKKIIMEPLDEEFVEKVKVV